MHCMQSNLGALCGAKELSCARRARNRLDVPEQYCGVCLSACAHDASEAVAPKPEGRRRALRPRATPRQAAFVQGGSASCPVIASGNRAAGGGRGRRRPSPAFAETPSFGGTAKRAAERAERAGTSNPSEIVALSTLARRGGNPAETGGNPLQRLCSRNCPWFCCVTQGVQPKAQRHHRLRKLRKLPSRSSSSFCAVRCAETPARPGALTRNIISRGSDARRSKAGTGAAP